MSFKFLDQVIDRYSELKYTLLKAQTFSPTHFGFPPICYKMMETDKTRVKAFTKAFEQYDFTGKVVCEAGVGTLALTKHFLPKVKKAYLIENNPDLRGFINKKLKENGWQHKTELIFGDAMKVELPEKVDCIVGELMSIFCIDEYQVQIFKHLRQFLKPDGKLLPERVINIIQLANVDFDEDYKHYPINFMRHLPETLSLQTVVNTVDLYKVTELDINKKIDIKPIMSGEANAVLIHSNVEIATGCNFTGTDSLMPPTVCKLDAPVQLGINETVRLNCNFKYGSNLDEAIFSVDQQPHPNL